MKATPATILDVMVIEPTVFCITSDSAEFLSKTTDYWHCGDERVLQWNDLALGIDWPPICAPLLAANDTAGRPLAECETYP